MAQSDKKFFRSQQVFIQFGKLSNVAILLVGPVVVGLLFGLWLDKLLKTTPVCIIGGTLCGFTVSIVSVYRMTKSL